MSEGDNVPISVMPRVWGHITGQLCRENLINGGWNDDDIETILAAIDHRKKMNIRPVTLAAFVLDPRFHGDKIFDEEWILASKFIVGLAEREGHQRLDVLRQNQEHCLVTISSGKLLIRQLVAGIQIVGG